MAEQTNRSPLRPRLKPPSKLVWLSAVFLAIALVAWAVVIASGSQDSGDPGRLTEAVSILPPDTAIPVLVDATAEWGLDSLVMDSATNAMAGGIASADFDNDGDLDFVVANGEVVIMLWETDGYRSSRTLDVARAAAVTASDVDNDGWADVLIAGTGKDLIVWGGSWIGSNSTPQMTNLPAGGASSGLLGAELSGDDAMDVLRLGRGAEEPAPDILWVGEPADRRAFQAFELPQPDRFSLAAELVDIDLDGLLDIWITRDVGWDTGGDSVLSRQGDPQGGWRDIGGEIGVDLEVDGMGVTVADLDGDARLDAYVSDLGDNEQLIRNERDVFAPAYDTGAARIRAPGAAGDVISSSWATGAVDLNLDGVLDLVVANGGFPNGSVRNKISETQIAVLESPAVLLGIGSGKFVDVWSQLDLDVAMIARGMLVADVDGDGDDDILIVDRRGSIIALRNDTLGGSVSINAADGCQTAGAVVTVTTGTRVFQTLLAPHTYAGAHSDSVIVGVVSEGANISVRWGDGSISEREIAVDQTRKSVSVSC